MTSDADEGEPPPLPEVWAELTFRGETLVPERVTPLLGLVPSTTWQRGELAFKKGPARWPDSGWQISTPHELTLDLPRHIGDLLELALPRKQAIHRLMAEPGTIGYIEGVSTGNEWLPDMRIERDSLERMAGLGLDLSFDVLLPGAAT